MFQTELHRWLQTFQAPLIEYLMRGISVFGEEEFLALVMLIAIFGVERRRGFLLTQTLLWTATITSILKAVVALPRPVDVDAMVRDITGERNVPTPFTGRGATGFLDLLPADVVAYFRALPHISFGFPSGHCSTSVATSGAAAILWRRPWLLIAAISLAVLMPLSRMYLGRHFLADVLGGLVIGCTAVLILVLVSRDTPTPRPGAVRRIAGGTIMFVLPAMGMALFPGAAANEAAMLLGVNIGQVWSTRVLPYAPPSGGRQRLFAVLLGVLSFIAFAIVFHVVPGIMPETLSPPVALLGRALTPCFAIFLTTLLTGKIRTRTQTR